MEQTITIEILHAFAATSEGGNPAAVVADATGLTEMEMQEIARKMGMSETVFVLPSLHADFRLRFFTPIGEVPLCGHATIAAWNQLLRNGQIQPGGYRQELLAGTLKIQVNPQGEVMMDQMLPAYGERFTAEIIAPHLGLFPEQILATGLPCRIVSTGMKDVMIPLPDPNLLDGLSPDPDRIAAFCETVDADGFHVFALTPDLPGIDARCRNFAPRVGIPEESATGSACGALGAYLFRHYRQQSCYTFRQGEAMGQDSKLMVKIEADRDTITRISLQGSATHAGQQHLTLS